MGTHFGLRQGGGMRNLIARGFRCWLRQGVMKELNTSGDQEICNSYGSPSVRTVAASAGTMGSPSMQQVVSQSLAILHQSWFCGATIA